VTIVVVLLVIVALAFALVVAVARDRGPSPADVAVAYELARDRRDATTLWNLSGSSLRAGRDRHAFVTGVAAEVAGEASVEVARVTVEDEYSGMVDASVLTRVVMTDGTEVQRRTRCAKEQGSWRVVSVMLGSDPEVQPPT